jgi:hypothetical protein
MRAKADAVADPIRCDYGDRCPGHASPDDRPCNWEPASEADALRPNDRHALKPVRDVSTPDNQIYWENAKATAAEVAAWPSWKRAGINVATERSAEGPPSTQRPAPDSSWLAPVIEASKALQDVRSDYAEREIAKIRDGAAETGSPDDVPIADWVEKLKASP